MKRLRKQTNGILNFICSFLPCTRCNIFSFHPLASSSSMWSSLPSFTRQFPYCSYYIRSHFTVCISLVFARPICTRLSSGFFDFNKVNAHTGKNNQNFWYFSFQHSEDCTHFQVKLCVENTFEQHNERNHFLNWNSLLCMQLVSFLPLTLCVLYVFYQIEVHVAQP